MFWFWIALSILIGMLVGVFIIYWCMVLTFKEYFKRRK